jgi:hypothetical protein
MSELGMLSLILLCVFCRSMMHAWSQQMISRIGIMLIDCHWGWMVSYRATRSCSCRLLDLFPSCRWPQLRPAIPAPAHVPRLLLPAITPTSCCWQGPRQCCCWAGHVLLRLMIGRRLGSHPVSTPSATPQLSGELLRFHSHFSTCFVHRAAAFLCSAFVWCEF